MTRLHRKCKACSALFAVDHRNSERHRFCSNPDCQRERRRREQRGRRTAALECLCAELLTDDPKTIKGLQKASPISEASIDAQSPILIGLISMLIDSQDRDEISRVLQKLWQRGFQILNPQLGQKLLKSLPCKSVHKPSGETQANG